jgi:hypothetical protein
MKTIKLLLFTILFSMYAFPVSAASAVQVWRCNLLDGKTQQDAIAASKVWLDAAKTMKGGAELEVYVGFPVVGDFGVGGFNFILVAKDMETWGAFWNGYDNSAAQKADADWENLATCASSSLESTIKIE